jgi:AcrR family transcriptional regulator
LARPSAFEAVAVSEAAPDAVAAPSTDRGRRRREAVLDAAEQLFHDRGFHGVSVDDLGAAAGISGPGLYRHFASKDALLMAVLDRIWVRLRPAVERAAELPPDQAIDVLLEAQLDLALEQPAALVLLVRELRHLPNDYRALARRNHQRYVGAWATAIAAGRPQLTDADARATALAVHGLIDSATLRAQALPRGLSREAHRQLLSRLARAVLDAAASAD